MICLFLLLAPLQGDEPSIGSLVQALGSDDIDTRVESALKLRRLGQEAVPELKKACHSSNSEISGRARTILQELFRPSVRKLEEQERMAFRLVHAGFRDKAKLTLQEADELLERLPWAELGLQKTVGSLENLKMKNLKDVPESDRDAQRLKLANLLELSIVAFEKDNLKQSLEFSRAMKSAFPEYPVGKDLASDLEKLLHKKELRPILEKKIAEWKKMTDGRKGAYPHSARFYFKPEKE